jgi:hypothetical protein
VAGDRILAGGRLVGAVIGLAYVHVLIADSVAVGCSMMMMSD